MSCKLIPADQAGIARPIAWRTPPGWAAAHPEHPGVENGDASGEPAGAGIAAGIQQQVEAAQQQIIAIVRQLEAEGVVSLKGTAGEQYVV